MAHLDKITIEHFRGFLAERQISLAVPNGNKGSGLTILVGPNNVGKSTIIEALRITLSPPQMMDRRERHVDRAVRISIQDTDKKLMQLTNPGLGAVISVQGEAHPVGKLRYVPARRSWTPRTSNRNIGPTAYWQQRTNDNRADDPNVVARLASFAPEEKVAFQQVITQLAPQVSNWVIEYSDGYSYLEYTTINGSTHTADLFGDGIASLFRIALALYDPDTDVCIVIDEPELSLHPQAQRRLADFISTKAAQRQIIVCTHSPYFVNWSDLNANAHIYRLRQDRNGIDPRQLSSGAVTGLKKLFEDWEKPQLLDPVAREVFFADEVVFFEGQEDIGLIRRFVETENLAPIQAFGYGVGGAGNIQYFLRMAIDLGIPAFAVFDRSSQAEYDYVRNHFPEARVELLPTEDIRDKPPRNGKGARDGLFNRDGTIKLLHRDYLIGLIAEIRAYLNDQAAP